jgi:DNA polymerase-3 subunit alpha
MLDGAARVDKLIKAALADNQPAVAITDHGVMYGVVDFVKTATKAGIKPIIGMEAYVTEGSRFDRPRGGGNRFHTTLLAENEVGYRNLMQLASRAYMEGYYYKPRMDHELLAEHAEGIIATSGCLGGQVPQLLAPDARGEEGNTRNERDIDAAIAMAATYQDIFGRDNFFIELHDHNFEAQRGVLPDLVTISEAIDAPLLATNDAHYVYPDEAAAHDALLCIQTGSVIDDERRFRFNGGPEYYLKSSQQMRSLFPDDQYKAACDNTLWIAERADVVLEFDKILLPAFDVPEGHSESTYLRELVMQGARERYGDILEDGTRDRIEHELKIIDQMGFPAYFLIVWDLMNYAREAKIRCGPGRGSAAGSIVSYCLRITNMDPMEYGLIFERFLNPGRSSMPDIDMDFDDRYRGEMIKYAARKYGSDHVAQIVTFSTIKGKQAVRDSARVLGLPYAHGDRISKMWPQAVLGTEAKIDDCLVDPGRDAGAAQRSFYNEGVGIRQAYADEPDIKKIIDMAMGLEGLRRQDSIHAAAVVISPTPLAEIVPLQRKGEGAETVTQYEMNAVEGLGLLKMDFLGLRNLTIIDRALEMIAKNHGVDVDIDNVDLTDEATFAMLAAGDTIGVFQLESAGLRSLLKAVEPTEFNDIIAVNALYRPGALGANMHTMYADRKNGRAQLEYDHPELENFLSDTYGIMVYQEQVMQVAQQIAGFTMAQADGLRKAMGKKIPSLMAQQEELFVQGSEANGHPAALGKRLFGLIEYFAGYGFNKSHSACYALVAFQTAWLKTHYPAEYMSALLTSTKKDKDKTSLYLGECRTMGIKVRPPDINRSTTDFDAVAGEILFGLSAIRNVGESVVAKITDARDADGPFKDIQDFLDRVDVTALNRRTLESLTKAGGFDSLGYSRKGLLMVLEGMLESTIGRRRKEEAGQFSLFGSGGDSDVETQGVLVIPEDEWGKKVKLQFEKEMLGLYISDHPLFGVEGALRALVTSDIAGLERFNDRDDCVVGGVVNGIQRKMTKAGRPMIFFQLEDLSGSTEVMMFSNTAEQYGQMVQEDSILLVKGRVDNRGGDDRKVMCEALTEPKLDPSNTVTLEVSPGMLSPDNVGKLKQILGGHPGNSPVVLHLKNSAGHKVLKLNDFQVNAGSELFAELRALFGIDAVA